MGGVEAAPGPVPAVPAAPSRGPLDPAAQGPAPGSRLAAGVTYANALAGLLVMLMRPAEANARSASYITIAIDVVVATSLLQGKAGARGWAILRAVLGALVLGPIIWSNGAHEYAVGQVLFSAGLLLLLVGQPGAWRLGAGTLTAGVVLAALVTFVAAPRTGRSVRGAIADLRDGGRHATELRGEDGGWTLALPDERWHQRERNGVRQASAYWPEQDAIVSVEARVLEGDVDLGASVDGILREARKRSGVAIREIERRPIRVPHGSGVAVHVTAVERGPPVEGWWVLVANGRRLALVIAVTAAAQFPELADELLAVASEVDVSE